MGLDPASGKIFWQHPFAQRMVINVPTPVIEGDRLFVTSFFDGSLMLKLRQDEPRVEQMWRRQGTQRASHRCAPRDDQHALHGRRLYLWRG